MTLSAFASILALDAEDSFPVFSIWDARAFALIARAFVSNGYFLSAGNANSDLGSLFLALDVNLAIISSSFSCPHELQMAFDFSLLWYLLTPESIDSKLSINLSWLIGGFV